MQVAARVCCDWLGMKEEAAPPRNSQVIQVTRRRVKAVCPGSKVIMTTAWADPDIVQEALVAGADGYWVKPFSRAKCRAAIQFAMADGFALGNHVKPAMLRGMAPVPIRRPRCLVFRRANTRFCRCSAKGCVTRK